MVGSLQLSTQAYLYENRLPEQPKQVLKMRVSTHHMAPVYRSLESAHAKPGQMSASKIHVKNYGSHDMGRGLWDSKS